MTRRYGACNSVIYSIHPHATGFRSVGTASTISAMAQHYSYKNTTNNVSMMRVQAGQQWGWEYETNDPFNPLVQVCRTSADAPLYIWEGETLVDPQRPAHQALSATNDTGTSIIPSGGSIVDMVMPTKTDMETIETDVLAASMPAWATGDVLAPYNTTTKLLKHIFQVEQSRAQLLYIKDDISDVYDQLFTNEEYRLYQLLWLRCASRILYAHYGQTLIPLALARFTVDSSGFVSL